MQNNKWNWINQENIIENNDTKKRCLVNNLIWSLLCSMKLVWFKEDNLKKNKKDNWLNKIEIKKISFFILIL